MISQGLNSPMLIFTNVCMNEQKFFFLPHSAGMYVHCKTQSFGNVFSFCVGLFCVNVYSPPSWYLEQNLQNERNVKKTGMNKVQAMGDIGVRWTVGLDVLRNSRQLSQNEYSRNPFSDLSNINHKHMHTGCSFTGPAEALLSHLFSSFYC